MFVFIYGALISIWLIDLLAILLPDQWSSIDI